MVVKLEVIEQSTKQCASAIYNYRVENIPEEFISWLNQFGSINVMNFTKKFFIFKHQSGLQLSSVVGGQNLKIYGFQNDSKSFNFFKTKIINYLSDYNSLEV